MDSDFLAEVAQTHCIRLLLQFRSSVTGQLHQDSDVDLAVLLERVPDSLAARADLAADLQALVADPEHNRLLYGSPRELDAFNRYAFKRYQDHRRYLALERDYVDRELDRMMR